MLMLSYGTYPPKFATPYAFDICIEKLLNFLVDTGITETFHSRDFAVSGCYAWTGKHVSYSPQF